MHLTTEKTYDSATDTMTFGVRTVRKWTGWHDSHGGYKAIGAVIGQVTREGASWNWRKKKSDPWSGDYPTMKAAMEALAKTVVPS